MNNTLKVCSNCKNNDISSLACYGGLPCWYCPKWRKEKEKINNKLKKEGKNEKKL